MLRIEPEKAVAKLWELFDKYEDLEHETCVAAAVLVKNMQKRITQLKQENKALQTQLAESQHREKAAMRDLTTMANTIGYAGVCKWCKWRKWNGKCLSSVKVGECFEWCDPWHDPWHDPGPREAEEEDEI